MIGTYDRRNCAVVAGGIFATYYLSTKLCNYYRKYRVAKKIETYNRQRLATFEHLKNSIDFTEDADVLQKRQAIIEMGFDSLRSALQNDELTPTEVLKTFQWSALQAQQRTNCVCEFLPEASTWATEVEEKYKNAPNKPPLYGVPVSFKECNFIKGHYATMGMAQFLNEPADRDSEWVQIMKSLGAVPFVTTNVPTTMMSIGSSNAIYGVTTNPYSSELGTGGSSSGEGALIGCRGSFLGLGSDIGGSVRIPAHCCGISSLKPTCGRLPKGLSRHPNMGISMIDATNGPMGIDVDSLIWFCRSVWSKDTKIREGNVIPLPFREEILSAKSKLTIGYYDYDGFIESTPATKRAVKLARETLQAAGHTLVPFDPPNVTELMRLFYAILIPDGCRYLGKLMVSDGVVDPLMKSLVNFCTMPFLWKKLIGFLFKPFSTHLSVQYGSFASSTSDLLVAFNQLLEYKMKFMDMWIGMRLDCVLCPVMPSTALTPELMVLMGVSYTGLYNALNFPAGVIPCIMTNKADDESMKSYKGKDIFSKMVKKSFEKSKKQSLPVGVQIVAMPYQEELCLRVMKELEVGLKNRFL